MFNLNIVMIDMPKEYIYEPWSAPLEVQRKAKCIIGKDYPKPGQCFSLDSLNAIFIYFLFLSMFLFNILHY